MIHASDCRFNYVPCFAFFKFHLYTPVQVAVFARLFWDRSRIDDLTAYTFYNTLSPCWELNNNEHHRRNRQCGFRSFGLRSFS
jgi:hypothetical protein